MAELISPEVECLKLKATINENHRLAQKSAGDAIERAIAAGELLGRWKSLLTHGKFEVFVGKHFEGSARTAQTYMKAAKGLSSLPKSAAIALLTTEDSLNGLMRRLKKDKPKKSTSEKGKPGGAHASASSDETPVSSGPASGEAAGSTLAAGRDARNSEGTPGTPEGGSNPPANASGEDERTDSQGNEAQETDPRPPRSGKEQKPAPVDYGKCPNCAGTKWDVEGEGVSCAKCHHPHGEPVGDRTEADPASDHRAKTTKALEAAMRGFDDLNLVLPKAGAHKQVIELCKNLLKSAKGWK